MDALEALSMLIVRADPEDSNQYPFWVAEVGKIEKDRYSQYFNKVQVCWYTPIKRGSKDVTNVQYLLLKFSAECSTHTDRRDKQSSHKAIKQVANWIDLDTIVVVFSCLLTGKKYQNEFSKKCWKLLLYVKQLD